VIFIITEFLVSIIIPVYNETAYIDRCLASLMKQTYSKKGMELLLIDGMSTDDTVAKIKLYCDDANIRILKNEKRLVTYALNIGIQNARGRYIIRMDAHSEYATDYVEKCVYYLENTDADNVGGVAITKGDGFFGEANAEILSSKFGVGNSCFRTESKSGYVDTVPFGAFRREIFDKIGVFNTALPRSEDNDFNSRIRAIGGKVYLSSDIHFTYYCRDTVKKIAIVEAIKYVDQVLPQTSMDNRDYKALFQIL
jgi:glycosyltransferase involved in cell wall biosynthesis